MPRTKKQDCGTCRNALNCWAPGISDDLIVTNLLVCRIKRGIDVNRSCKLFLEMVRPALKAFSKKAIRNTAIEPDIALADFESKTIELLQNTYIQGEYGYPLHFLFGQPRGHIRLYSYNYAKDERKNNDHMFLQKSDSLQTWDSLQNKHPTEVDDMAEFYGPARLTGASGCSGSNETHYQTDKTSAAREVIYDGVTLDSTSFRVASFCLTNASEAKRPLSGLHVYMSKVTNIPRTKVTKIWSDSCKLLQEELST